MTLAAEIIAAVSALLGILGELLAGRKTEAEARAECLASGYLIAPGAAHEELARHEEAAK
jgi:hypothetical protein